MPLSSPAVEQNRARQRLTVTGVVQGVGFRPFVYGLARSHGLAGFVGNNSGGVFIEIEGPPEQLESFRQALVNQPPPLAHIETVTVDALAVQDDVDFVIVHSKAQAAQNTLISPDICTCEDCLRELQDPADRRYGYPFTNCTNCGPRFTIIRDIPYDRPLTTMADFPMCPSCQAEYENPLDRRFHAQPNACPECGPHVAFEWTPAAEVRLEDQKADAVAAAQQVIHAGGVVAVKGLGGFHLACDATNDAALARLRERKGRVDKPFAVMVASLEAARACAEISDAEVALLTARERPIVLLQAAKETPLSPLVAPGNGTVGIMLPYTPLHTLLLADMPPLVMTSGNYSDEPIVKENAEARARLGTLADAFLMHNRDIYAHCDDSVIRVFEGRELPVRRSRGYAPFPVKLPFTPPPTLAVGGELKATFCLTKDAYAFMSQHIGDMENLETLQAFEQAVGHFKSIFRVKPEVIVSDMHPRYLSSRWAAAHDAGLHHVQVQHHHAHIAAVMAEHGLRGEQPVIGFSFDGTGYGTDGAIWGGEVMVADYRGFERVAHLQYVPLPGGDAAVKRPYRVALAHLWAAGVAGDDTLPPVQACSLTEQGVLRRQLETGLNAVPTSSMGRLFDAVAALAGVRQTVTYEAQAAIELEALAERNETGAYRFNIVDGSGGAWTFDAAPVIAAVADDVKEGVPVGRIAARFHHGVAQLILDLSMRLRDARGLEQVALSGGVFQNVTLLEETSRLLREEGFEVLIHRQVPPNDGGLALGQAVIGAQAHLS